MMPSAKMVKRDSALPLEQFGQDIGVDSRDGDVGAYAEDHQRGEQEQQPALKIAVARTLANVG
jgi:hypothetical protein